MSNLNTILSSLSGARIIDLAQPMKRGMPQSPNHPPFRMILERRHGDMVRADGGSASNEIIVTGGHVGTHIDGLSHVSHEGKLFGGVDAYEAQGADGFKVHGIDTMTPFVGRGVLLDIARLHGVPTLPAGYGITADDLTRAEKAQGISVQAGDSVLIGSGWSRRWNERDAFIGLTDGVPGVDTSGAEWIASRKVKIAAGETIAFEQITAGAGHSLLPVHRILLVEHGIHIMETLKLDELLDAKVSEFLFIVSPLRVVGATGAPVRPLAILP
ncbi:MAG: cyclase family protein [Actinomycetes bacterium]